MPKNVVEPWGPQKPRIEHGLNLADTVMQRPPEYYPGSAVTPFSSVTNDAMNARLNRGMMGSPQEQAFGGYINNTLRQPQVDLQGAQGMAHLGMMGAVPGIGQLAQTAQGGYLNSNPYLDGMFNSAAQNMGRQFDRASNQVNATFGAGGRANSGAHAYAMGEAAEQYSDSLAGLANNIYGGNYQQERGRQMQAAGSLAGMGFQGAGLNNQLFDSVNRAQAGAASMVPTHTGLQYGNIDQIGQVGAQLDQQAGHYLQDDINRFNHSQQGPWSQIGDYMGIVGHPYGSTGYQSGPSPFARALGGAGTGLAIGKAIGGPAGAGLGAAAGGILGLFG